MRTYVPVGAVAWERAALARATLRSCSSAYCLSKPPAAARVVARAENRISGGTEDWDDDVSCPLLAVATKDSHLVVSFST